MENQVAGFGRELSQAPAQALYVPVGVDFEFRGLNPRLRRVFQGTRLLGAVAGHLPKEHARNSDAVSPHVPNLLAIPDLPRATIHGLIGIFVRCGAPAPLE